MQRQTVSTDQLRVRVSPDKILISDLLLETDSEKGAQIIFTGRVRGSNLNKKVKEMEYDAHVPIAENELRKIANEAFENCSELEVQIQHRLGRLEVGEISVFICVSSRHRHEAYEASRYIIEQLKMRVPIWKKEYYESGESEWLRGHALCAHPGRQELRAESNPAASALSP